MEKTITIEEYNKLMGQEMLHPLITVIKGGERTKNDEMVATQQKFLLTTSQTSFICDFYALLYAPSRMLLRLYCPGDTLEMDVCEGILFHPDLLSGTHMEKDINKYPVRCSCKLLSVYERLTIRNCIDEIECELHHSIDRFTAPIIVSHIGLLLDYCVRFCDATCKTVISIGNLDRTEQRKMA